MNSTDALFKPIDARKAREDGLRLFQAPKNLVGKSSTELVPGPQDSEPLSPTRLRMLDTLATPNIISVDASEHRASLAARAQVLSLSLDTQETAQADNSIEKMICHQLAALHTLGMEEVIRLKELSSTYPAVERARALNSIVRLFESAQNAALTVQKLKSGGTQRVEVRYQQVNVGQGGHAVGTERVGRGARRSGRVAKNGE